MELCHHHVDVARLLEDACGEVRPFIVGVVVAHTEIGVVLHLLDADTEGGVGLFIGEDTLEAGARLGREVVVPPHMFAVIFRHEEAGVVAVEVGIGSQSHGVAEERKVQVGAEVEMQLTDIISGHPRLYAGVEMEGAALCLREATADGDIVLRPLVAGGDASQGVDHLKAAVLVGGEDLESRLDVFVEAFKQSDGEDVLQHGVVCLVVNGVVG